MARMVAAALVSLPALTGCIATPDEIRAAPPGMVAVSALPAEAVHECLTRAWENTRLFRFDPPVSVSSRFAQQRGSIDVRTPESPGLTSWLIDVTPAPQGSSIRAWSQYMVHADQQAELSVVMLEHLATCRATVTSNRIDPPVGRTSSGLSGR